MLWDISDGCGSFVNIFWFKEEKEEIVKFVL